MRGRSASGGWAVSGCARWQRPRLEDSGRPGRRTWSWSYSACSRQTDDDKDEDEDEDDAAGKQMSAHGRRLRSSVPPFLCRWSHPSSSFSSPSSSSSTHAGSSIGGKCHRDASALDRQMAKTYGRGVFATLRCPLAAAPLRPLQMPRMIRRPLLSLAAG